MKLNLSVELPSRLAGFHYITVSIVFYGPFALSALICFVFLLLWCCLNCDKNFSNYYLVNQNYYHVMIWKLKWKKITKMITGPKSHIRVQKSCVAENRRNIQFNSSSWKENTTTRNTKTAFLLSCCMWLQNTNTECNLTMIRDETVFPVSR